MACQRSRGWEGFHPVGDFLGTLGLCRGGRPECIVSRSVSDQFSNFLAVLCDQGGSMPGVDESSFVEEGSESRPLA